LYNPKQPPDPPKHPETNNQTLKPTPQQHLLTSYLHRT
jgi:hypothetical protein